jgi:signal transduction histidine kinase
LQCEYHNALRPAVSIDETAATHLYRIAQEAMANAAKHAGAHALRVSLSSSEHGLVLQIADDGRGIPAAMQAEPTGMGLKLMEYRARMIGGEIGIAPGESGGTVVSCVFPLSPSGRFVRPRPKAAASAAKESSRARGEKD